MKETERKINQSIKSITFFTQQIKKAITIEFEEVSNLTNFNSVILTQKLNALALITERTDYIDTLIESIEDNLKIAIQKDKEINIPEDEK